MKSFTSRILCPNGTIEIQLIYKISHSEYLLCIDIKNTKIYIVFCITFFFFYIYK
jgi:hypothetical protein